MGFAVHPLHSSALFLGSRRQEGKDEGRGGSWVYLPTNVEFILPFYTIQSHGGGGGGAMSALLFCSVLSWAARMMHQVLLKSTKSEQRQQSLGLQ
jgi:hypothetical protein